MGSRRTKKGESVETEVGSTAIAHQFYVRSPQTDAVSTRRTALYEEEKIRKANARLMTEEWSSQGPFLKRDRVRSRGNRDIVRARGLCEYCGKREGAFEVHHIRPRSQGGGDEIENLACLCGGPQGCHAKVTTKVIKLVRREHFEPPEAGLEVDSIREVAKDIAKSFQIQGNNDIFES
jgi:5-methylcytosine-specific restriction endonuclease McrA